MFETMDADQYDQLQNDRRDDDFIVDDEGYGYKDTGGEIWDYQDGAAGKAEKGGKRQKKSAQVSAFSLLKSDTSPLIIF